MKTKSISEINERIKKGQAVVLTADEMSKLVAEIGAQKAAQEVDVVATGTFSPMCSSGLLFNIGQATPPTMKTSQCWLNDVPAYAGIAAADNYLGATQTVDGDPLNKVYPGRFSYGGGHVIEDLVSGKSVNLRAESYGTDCYPRKNLERTITINDLPYAELVNPRNCYQNYNVAINTGSKLLHTYMGPLKSGVKNANFATAGLLSPLFNDPYFKTIGIGTRILLGGAKSYVIGAGTQHVPAPKRQENGLPLTPSGTLFLKGNLKNMNPRYVRGLSLIGYGCSISLGVAIPIPILNAEIAQFTGVRNEDILMPVRDYAADYPNGIGRIIKHVSYAELMSGKIDIQGQEVESVPLTSYSMSLEVAQDLKKQIENGSFLLTEPVELIESN